eukprot:scaffold63_cov306-Pinguiococcus_pyrenoidosus.AAC.68
MDSIRFDSTGLRMDGRLTFAATKKDSSQRVEILDEATTSSSSSSSFLSPFSEIYCCAAFRTGEHLLRGLLHRTLALEQHGHLQRVCKNARHRQAAVDAVEDVPLHSRRRGLRVQQDVTKVEVDPTNATHVASSLANHGRKLLKDNGDSLPLNEDSGLAWKLIQKRLLPAVLQHAFHDPVHQDAQIRSHAGEKKRPDLVPGSLAAEELLHARFYQQSI